MRGKHCNFEKFITSVNHGNFSKTLISAKYTRIFTIICNFQQAVSGLSAAQWPVCGVGPTYGYKCRLFWPGLD